MKEGDLSQSAGSFHMKLFYVFYAAKVRKSMKKVEDSEKI